MAKFFTLRYLVASLFGLTLGLAGLTQAVWAIGLDAAKGQGLVGEQPNGYLEAVKADAAGEVRALVADINAKRRQKYEEIAEKNQTSLQVVEALAGKTAIEKTPPGQYIKSPSGTWMIK
ncbi:YdbL family protein [Methylococcus mesophilus]|uniref:YdbL family protein n=1 Tax=Methylococcus mesophilus TaxID=2993564 RepID=UPI00224A6864|nr:YdbL family protein [Methylococcus mesophilus]UZR29796.1 YdbL family protein [Methylococcus mesophilus]